MPDPLVVTTMNAFKADLLRQETTQMAAMARRWRQTEAALIDQVELFARRVADDKLSRAQLQDAQYMLDRSQSLLRQARVEFNKYVRYAGPLIATRQRQLGEQGIQHAAAAINAVGTEAGVEIDFNRLPVSAVENMVGLAGDNSPLTTLLESKYGAGVDGMFTELIRATALGKNPRETAERMVREGFSQSLTQMMVIARTEQLRVYREAARQAYQESGVVEAFRRLATRDNRVCAACMMADGEYYELNEFLRAHPQCVIEGTVVSTPSVRGTSKRRYNGPVFDILTVSGNHLTVTPNHPVLTDHGWVAAGLLKIGDNVISSRDGKRTAGLVDPDNQQGPAVIENIVAAFGESINVVSIGVPTSAVDFHGDGMDGDIAIVGTNRLLRNGIDTSFAQPLSQDYLLGGCVRCGTLSADGAVAQGVPSSLRPSNGIMGALAAPDVFFGGRLGGSQSIRGGLTPDFDIGQFQSAAYNGSHRAVGFGQSVLGFAGQVAFNNFVHRQIDSRPPSSRTFGDGNGVAFGVTSKQPATLEFISQGLIASSPAPSSILDAFAGDIFFDSVVQVSSRYFSGHVYNLETDTGWYVANNIITHNCRCTIIPVVEGFPPVEWQKGPDWFLEQSEGTQTKILGPGRYAAWKDGLFDLDQLMALRTNAQWGDSVQPASLKALLDGTAQRYNVQRELPNPFGRNDAAPPPWVTGATGTASRGGQEVPTAADMEAARLRGEARRREEEERQRQAAEERRLQEEREAAAREALRLRQEQEEREAAAARATARAQDGGASATRARIVEIADTYQPRIDELKRDAEKMQTERGALLSLVGKLEINAARRAGTPQEQQLLNELEQKRAEQTALSQRVLANRRQQNALTAEMDGKISPLLTVSNPARATLRAQGEPDATVAVWQTGLDQFNRMVSSDIVPPGSIPFRRQDDDFAAHYNTNDKTVNLGRQARPGIVAHELMHWLEDHNPEILQKQLDFFNRRTAGETTTQLDKNNANIVGKRDKFIVYYMGREYVYRGVHVATEIGSMGLEYMIERPIELARKDPDMFDFIFDLLRGR